MPTPAPLVGQTGGHRGAAGKVVDAHLELAGAFCTPTSDPVEPSVAEQAPAARSSVPADEATPAHLPWYTESFTYCSAFTSTPRSRW